jgi:hypothetical protein
MTTVLLAMRLGLGGKLDSEFGYRSQSINEYHFMLFNGSA